MKLKSTLGLLTKLTLTTLLLSPITFADEGTRGGGQTVDVNGHPVLRDLVHDHATSCDWKFASEVWEENPEIEKILKKLAEIDWYFASDLKKEIHDLSYCYTT